MIGIEGQFIFDLKTELNSSLVQYSELISFTSIEECGLLLPVFKISLIISDIKNLSYFHEGSIIKLAIGKTKKDLKYINLQVVQISETLESAKNLSIVATLYKPSYSRTTKIRPFSNKTTVEVLKEIVGAYFEIESNISISSDRRNWFQFGLSDKNFVEFLWLNSSISSGILALGCSATDNKFIIKDIIKEFTKSSYDFRASYKQQNKEDFQISNIFGTSGSYGFYNSWKAHNKTGFNFNPSTSEFESFDFGISSLLSTSNKISNNDEVEKDMVDITYSSDFSYSRAKKYNLFALSNYSKYQIEVESVGYFHEIKLLDKIYLDLKEQSKNNEEYFSGNYLVSRVVRSIVNNQYSTKVTLTRESPGNLR